MSRLKRTFQTLKSAVGALWMPDAYSVRTDKDPTVDMTESIKAQRARLDALQNAVDLRYAMTLLYDSLHALEQVDLMHPDPFMIQCALQFLRLAKTYLPGPWRQCEQEIAAKAQRGMERLKEDGIV